MLCFFSFSVLYNLACDVSYNTLSVRPNRGVSPLKKRCHYDHKLDMMMRFCNIMVEGFRFMPLGLVRLRTFRLSAWVS